MLRFAGAIALDSSCPSLANSHLRALETMRRVLQKMEAQPDSEYRVLLVRTCIAKLERSETCECCENLVRACSDSAHISVWAELLAKKRAELAEVMANG